MLRTRLGRDPTPAECKRACPRAYGLKKRNPGGTPPTGQVAEVWDAWRAFQKRPDEHSLDVDTRELITKALRSVDSAKLVEFIRHAHTADAPGPRYWRGHNQQRRTYLGLSNLLNPKKLQDRIGEMNNWLAGDEGQDVNTGFDPGPYGGPGKVVATEELAFTPKWRR
jgi:hypothetical protein